MVTFSEFQQLKSLSPEEQDEILGGSTEEELSQLEVFENQPQIQQPQLDQVQQSFLEQEAIAGGRFPGQSFVPSAEPVTRQAQLQALPLQETAGGLVENVADLRNAQLRDIPFQEIGATVGTGGGALLGAGGASIPLGLAGGTLGGALGRQIDVATGRIPAESTLGSFARATGEEILSAGAGAAIKPVLNAIGKPILRGVSRLSEGTPLQPITDTIFKNPEKLVQERLLTTASIDPTNTRVITIDDASKRLLGTNDLTPFEQSGGQAGQGLQKRLNVNIQDQIDKNLLDSTFLKSRKVKQDRIQSILSGEENIVTQSGLANKRAELGAMLKTQFVDALDNIKELKDPVAKISNNLATKADVDITGLLPRLNNLRQEALIATGGDTERVNLVFDTINAKLAPRGAAITPRRTVGGTRSVSIPDKGNITPERVPSPTLGFIVPPKRTVSDPLSISTLDERALTPRGIIGDSRSAGVSDTKTLATKRTVSGALGFDTPNKKTFFQLDALNNRVERKLQDFNAGKDIQEDRVGAWYSKNIKPILRDIKRTSGENTPDGSVQKDALAARDKLDELLKVQDLITDNTIGRDIGISAPKQKFKKFSNAKVLEKMFESVESWNAVENILDLSGNSETIGFIKDRFKLDILKDSFDPRLGEVTFDKLMAVRNKFGDDVITRVGGEQYANDLIDTALITRALESTSALRKLEAGVPVDLTKEAAGLFRPLQQDVKIFQATMGGAKKVFGLDKLNDKEIFNKIKGDRGLRLLEKLQATPLDSPGAYLAYVELARTLGVNPIQEADFSSAASNTVNAIANGIAEFNQQQ